jgi:hypothetical protein
VFSVVPRWLGVLLGRGAVDGQHDLNPPRSVPAPSGARPAPRAPQPAPARATPSPATCSSGRSCWRTSLFLLWPFARGVWISLHDWNLLAVAINPDAKTASSACDNYVRMLWGEGIVWSLEHQWAVRARRSRRRRGGALGLADQGAIGRGAAIATIVAGLLRLRLARSACTRARTAVGATAASGRSSATP